MSPLSWLIHCLFSGLAYICILGRNSFCLYKSSHRSQRGDQQRGSVCFITNSTWVSRCCWGQQQCSLSRAETSVPSRSSAEKPDNLRSCIRSTYSLRLAVWVSFPGKPSALTSGLGSQVAVQLRAWSWPVWVAHCLSRMLLLALWLAGSGPCWRILSSVVILFVIGSPCWDCLLWDTDVLPLCNLFELCFFSHCISH